MPPKPLFPNVFPGDGAPRKRRLALALLAVPGLVPAVSYAQLSGAAAQPQPLDSPWDLRLAPQLEDHPLKDGAKPAAFVIADHTSGTAEQDLAAKGSAELRRGDAVVKADALHYDQDTDMADAYGQVRVINGGTSFAGPEAHLKVEANQGVMTAPKYHFNVTGGSGSAERVDLLDSERSVFVNGTYTACQCSTNPAWYIKGSRFDFDTGADEGTVRNGVLFFQGVPIFASPWLTFPLSGERRSGLLPPTFSMNSNNGFELTLPYYFNIAPNRDLTITPRIISRRGVQTEATFRYLSPTYSGTLTANYLPDDRLAHRNRYAIYWQHQQNFGGGFGGYVYFNKVSDNTYPEDLGSTNEFINGTQTLYQQEAGLTYNNGPWSVLARYQHWQTLPPSIAPYSREPQLNVKYTKYNVGGFDFGAEADYSRFRITTADATEGDRIVFNPYIAYGVYGPGYFVVPKVQYHFASYDLNYLSSSTPNSPKRFTESIPTVSFDTGLIFDRSVRLFGQDFIQTLEPRLYYVYTPYRDQSNAPLFDTAESDFGLAEIYQPNTFVGKRPDRGREPDHGRPHVALHRSAHRRRTRALRDRAAVLLRRSARDAELGAVRRAGAPLGPDRRGRAEARLRLHVGNGVPVQPEQQPAREVEHRFRLQPGRAPRDQRRLPLYAGEHDARQPADQPVPGVRAMAAHASPVRGRPLQLRPGRQPGRRRSARLTIRRGLLGARRRCPAVRERRELVGAAELVDAIHDAADVEGAVEHRQRSGGGIPRRGAGAIRRCRPRRRRCPASVTTSNAGLSAPVSTISMEYQWQ